MGCTSSREAVSISTPSDQGTEKHTAEPKGNKQGQGGGDLNKQDRSERIAADTPIVAHLGYTKNNIPSPFEESNGDSHTAQEGPSQPTSSHSQENGSDTSLQSRRASGPLPNGTSTPTPVTAARANSAPANVFDFTGAPLPDNEEERHQALCGLEVLDSETKPDERFDDITKLLCQIFHVPVAIVSLVDKDRQWFKSVQGLPVNSTERRASFCAWTLLPQHPEILVVPDALEDIRFAENPLVLNEPFIRFYAGAPLITSTGHRLGSLCIIDRKPRELEAESCNVLINFAEVVMRELEKEKMRALEAARMKSQTSGLLRAFDAFKEGIMICSSSSPSLEILFFNDAWCKLTGMDRADALGRSVWDLFEVSERQEKILTLSRHAIEASKPFQVDLKRVLPDGSKIRFLASFRPGTSEGLDEHMPAVAIPGSMASWNEDGVADDLYFCTMQRRVRSSSDSGTSSGQSHFRAEPSLAPTHPFDDVELGPMLGQGSFGKVFRGIWNGAHVAVKIIQPPVGSRGSPGADDPNSALAVSNKAALECLLTAQISHPNIIATYKSAQVPYKVGEDLVGNSPPLFESWLVLEYCDQGTLQYALDRGKFDEGFIKSGKRNKLPHIYAVKQTAYEIAAAMCYLHGKDILHGDLCGGNILLSASSRDERGFIAKVADFGLARNLDTEAIMTSTYGTVTHMPPELLTTGHLSKAADSFAWGAILWELFSGERPWPGMLPMQVIYHVTILGKKLKFPETTPEGYRELGEACLDADPEKRPTFAQILRKLNEL